MPTTRQCTVFALIALLLCWFLVAPAGDTHAAELTALVFAGFVLAVLFVCRPEQPPVSRPVLVLASFSPRPPPVCCL